jgi:hypothetical protein
VTARGGGFRVQRFHQPVDPGAQGLVLDGELRRSTFESTTAM